MNMNELCFFIWEQCAKDRGEEMNMFYKYSGSPKTGCLISGKSRYPDINSYSIWSDIRIRISNSYSVSGYRLNCQLDSRICLDIGLWMYSNYLNSGPFKMKKLHSKVTGDTTFETDSKVKLWNKQDWLRPVSSADVGFWVLLKWTTDYPKVS
jgi:hypothetical protein